MPERWRKRCVSVAQWPADGHGGFRHPRLSLIHISRLQIAQLAPQTIADDMPERARILEIATALDPEFVQLAYQIAVHGRQELPLAPDEQAGFIMTLLRLYAFRPVSEDESGGRRAAGAQVRPAATPAGRAEAETARPAEPRALPSAGQPCLLYTSRCV